MSEAASGLGAAAGDGGKAASELLPVLYDELRRLGVREEIALTGGYRRVRGSDERSRELYQLIEPEPGNGQAQG
jgi:hypothetical protein